MPGSIARAGLGLSGVASGRSSGSECHLSKLRFSSRFLQFSNHMKKKHVPMESNLHRNLFFILFVFSSWAFRDVEALGRVHAWLLGQQSPLRPRVHADVSGAATQPAVQPADVGAVRSISPHLMVCSVLWSSAGCDTVVDRPAVQQVRFGESRRAQSRFPRSWSGGRRAILTADRCASPDGSVARSC